MAKNRTLLIVLILSSILSLVGSFVVNIASNNLPASWKPYLWFIYPISAIIVVLTVVLVIWQWHLTSRQDDSNNPIQSIDSQKADSIYNAPGGTINVNVKDAKELSQHNKDYILPGLELKLIDNMKQHIDQLAFFQTTTNENFQFGIALINNIEGSMPAEKLDITIECSWEGTDIRNAPKFKTDTHDRTTSGWIATKELIQQGEVPYPAKLSFRGSADDRCAHGHNLEWYRFSVVLFERMSGRFILNYKISSAYPIIANNKGALFIYVDSGKFGTKSIILTDIISREELHIEFNLTTDKIEINGELVKRVQALESNDNQFVFIPVPSDGQKVYHLSRQQIEMMRSL